MFVIGEVMKDLVLPWKFYCTQNENISSMSTVIKRPDYLCKNEKNRMLDFSVKKCFNVLKKKRDQK